MSGNVTLQETYEEALRGSESFAVIPVSRDILVAAAKTRAEISSVRLADAIHFATALLNRCGTLLTNDSRLKGLTGIRVLLLSDFREHDRDK